MKFLRTPQPGNSGVIGFIVEFRSSRIEFDILLLFSGLGILSGIVSQFTVVGPIRHCQFS
jgi:hypothetical protein